MLIHLCIAYGCFCTTMTESSTCKIDCMVHKDKNIYHLVLSRKCLDLELRSCTQKGKRGKDFNNLKYYPHSKSVIFISIQVFHSCSKLYIQAFSTEKIVVSSYRIRMKSCRFHSVPVLVFPFREMLAHWWVRIPLFWSLFLTKDLPGKERSQGYMMLCQNEAVIMSWNI